MNEKAMNLPPLAPKFPSDRDIRRSRAIRIVQELNDSSPDCMAATAELEILRLEDERVALRALARAVQCREFGGIHCDDVDGKNWFDLRDELLAKP